MNTPQMGTIHESLPLRFIPVNNIQPDGGHCAKSKMAAPPGARLGDWQTCKPDGIVDLFRVGQCVRVGVLTPPIGVHMIVK